VPGEPGRLLLAVGDGASQRDLERPLAQRQPGQVVAGMGEVVANQPVEPVDLPVQLLLYGDHPRPHLL